ncbi:MAG: ATP-grasp domain-containing protein [Planctomycetota bacterium]|nr:ATP-grasp domain-containing protein [Planctomycetota bacterium]
MNPRIALVHFDPGEENFSQSAINLVDRVQFLPHLARELDMESVSISASEVLEGDAASQEKLRTLLCGCAVIFWRYGRTALSADLLALEKTIQELCGGRFFDSAEAIDESFNLSKFYPLFEKAGLPQASTTLVPLNSELCFRDKNHFVKEVKKRLPWRLPKSGVFLRTFYSTRKGFPGMNYAMSKAELLDRCWNQLEHFRDQNIDIGGFAIREFLNLQACWDEKQRYSIPREFRIFVLDGQPIFWVYHLPLEELRYQLKAPDWDILGTPSAAQLQLMREYATRGAAVLKTRFLTIDFALLETGELTVVEANPAYCAGWNHRGALVGLYAQVFQRLVGRPLFSRDRLYELAERLDVDFWKEDEVFGFFDV